MVIIPSVVVPIVLLVALLLVVFIGNSMKKKGSMSESAYQGLVTVASLIVTLVALVVMYLRMKR
jgi:hypothetical protein